MVKISSSYNSFYVSENDNAKSPQCKNRQKDNDNIKTLNYLTYLAETNNKVQIQQGSYNSNPENEKLKKLTSNKSSSASKTNKPHNKIYYKILPKRFKFNKKIYHLDTKAGKYVSENNFAPNDLPPLEVRSSYAYRSFKNRRDKSFVKSIADSIDKQVKKIFTRESSLSKSLRAQQYTENTPSLPHSTFSFLDPIDDLPYDPPPQYCKNTTEDPQSIAYQKK